MNEKDRSLLIKELNKYHEANYRGKSVRSCELKLITDVVEEFQSRKNAMRVLKILPYVFAMVKLDYTKEKIGMNENSLAFVVYLIHELANKKNMTPGQVYEILKKYSCIDNYLVPYYDVLHTQGTEYLMEDVSGYIAKRGGVL